MEIKMMRLYIELMRKLKPVDMYLRKKILDTLLDLICMIGDVIQLIDTYNSAQCIKEDSAAAMQEAQNKYFEQAQKPESDDEENNV